MAGMVAGYATGTVGGNSVASVQVKTEAPNPIIQASVAKLFDATRKRLVETGTRNRLVHVNRANTRGNVINIVNERSDDVHARLVAAGETMRFLAIGPDKDEDRDEITFGDAPTEAFDANRYTDAQLETKLGPDALTKKLLKIYREAQTAEEESGVNILYLAIGFLTWFEDKSSSVPREAPLILLPVELVRNARTSTYDIRARDEEALTNLPLQQRLRDDFGIDLPEIDIGEEWKPSDYFADVATIIAQRQQWKIEPDAIQLGFFSFSKLLMFRDLAIDAWPEGALAAHALTRGLLYEGFDGEKALFGADDRLDEVLPPEKLFHVVDADASQAKVIEEVRSGKNLVVQGPPGTGKSQTITNIIAAAAKEGKRVLFLAEKMAALSVVHDRLVKVGLRDVCLELHSRTANKKAVLGELARTIVQGATVPEVPAGPNALKRARDRLNVLAEALHRPIGTTGETAYSVLGRQSRFIGADRTPPIIASGRLASITREDEDSLIVTVKRYGELLSAEGRAEGHPFAATGNLDLQPVDIARLGPLLKKAKLDAELLASALREAGQTLEIKIPQALESASPLRTLLEHLEFLPNGSAAIAREMLILPDLPRLCEILKAGAEWKEARDQADTVFVEAAFEASASIRRGPLVAGSRSFFARWGKAYREASGELARVLREALPKTATARVGLVDRLVGIAAKKALWSDDKDYCGRILGDVWRGERTDFARLGSIADWCVRIPKSPLLRSPDQILVAAGKAEALFATLHSLREAELATRASLQEVCRILELDIAVLGGDGLESVDLVTAASRFGAMSEAIDRYASWVELARQHRALTTGGLEISPIACVPVNLMPPRRSLNCASRGQSGSGKSRWSKALSFVRLAWRDGTIW